MSITRRTFLQSAATLAASGHLHALVPSDHAHSVDTREPLQQFPYSAVQLTGGPFAEQYDALHAHYLSLSNDSLLKVYRERAGLPAPGADMGGWYDFDGFVPGHSLGQYISGLARIGASTGDPTCHAKVHQLVEGFAATLGPDNQSIIRPSSNLWTCYTLDKHLAGLIDAATLSEMQSAKELLNRVLAGAEPLMPIKGRDRVGKKDPPYDETYVMPENLFLAAEVTGNPAFTGWAHRYLLDRELFDPLVQGKDPFPGQHAYSHAIALSSAGRAYLTLGDAKYKQAMLHAFTLLTTTQQFASGGWGPNETFITPHQGELHASLATTVDHFETPCGAYAATKLARYLIRTTRAPGDTAFADNLERVLYNTILAVKQPDSNGDYPYYSTYSQVAEKVYYQKKWPCCSGTLIQTVADYPLNVYFHAEDASEGNHGIYVGQYVPSRLALTHRGTAVHLTQETDYPATETSVLTLQLAAPMTFTIFLRVPGWLDTDARVRVNGKAVSTSTHPNTWAAIRRNWRSGDRVEIALPQSFRTEPIDDQHPETVALMRGPVQYVALNPTVSLSSERLTLPSGLRQIAGEAFVENYAGREVVFVPLYRVRNETYTSYFSKA